jgi:hypothetical protein
MRTCKACLLQSQSSLKMQLGVQNSARVQDAVAHCTLSKQPVAYTPVIQLTNPSALVPCELTC